MALRVQTSHPPKGESVRKIPLERAAGRLKAKTGASKKAQIDWMDGGDMERVMEAISNRSLYPDNGGAIQVKQTHISTVFLTPEYVFKFKRPVDLGFADFTKLGKRRHFCHEELRLNARLAQDVYLDVLPLSLEGGELNLGGAGKRIDYAVVMRRLAKEDMLDDLLAENKVAPEQMHLLAERLVAFHKKGKSRKPHISQDAFGSLEVVSQNWEENFTQVHPYLNVSLYSEQYQLIQREVFRFLTRNRELFQRRIAQGYISDGHGDLRAEHIFMKEGIKVIDCIEFNMRFRFGDVVSDLAFLLMDLVALGHPLLAQELADAYQEKTNDEEMFRLIPFYACYRAFVRGKVLSFKLSNKNLSQGEYEEILHRARYFFDLAQAFALKMTPPLVVLVGGLMGSGKTTVAEALSVETKACLLSSDVIRKELTQEKLKGEGTEGSKEKFGQGAYTEDWTNKTYQTMFARTAECLKRGSSVILDASFSKKKRRLQAQALAKKQGAEVLVVECRLEEEKTLVRLAQREREGNSPSDGRVEIYPFQKKAFDPVEIHEFATHLVLHTDQPPSQLIQTILNFEGVSFRPPLFF